MKDFVFKVDEKEYPVHIIYKRIKNIHYRFDNGCFIISCHYLTPKVMLLDGLNKFAKGLIKRSIKNNMIGDDFIYLYGNKISIGTSGSIKFSDDSVINYSSKEDLMKQLKARFLKLMTNRTNYYAKMMDLPVYKVKVRNMKTRYGSNSLSSQTIHYSTVLQHYSIEIIDSVVVHELAHILVPNHSDKFYNVVYKYCPNYPVYRKKLIRGEFQ